MSEEDMAAQLAAAFDGHQVTDQEGNLIETETIESESAPIEETTDDETAPGENPLEFEPQAANPVEEDDENQLAEDDSGKKYVPENRFKKVYGKMKEYERQLGEYESLKAKGEALLQKPNSKSKPSEVKVDKADILELKMTLPQFNPASDKYDEELDQLGFELLRANPGITPLEAGRMAIEKAKRITEKYGTTKIEARSVKAQQSDSGITSRRIVSSNTPDPDKMSEAELEAYLKQTGQW